MADKIVANNKKAFHEYFIEDKYEAGLVLVGTEVKSIRQGKVNLKDSYVSIKNGEAFVYNMHISCLLYTSKPCFRLLYLYCCSVLP